MTTFTWENLKAGYGETEVLHKVTASLNSGDVLGVVGRNGVGKTTLCRAISGNGKIFDGDVCLNDQSLLKMSNSEIHRLGISYCPQENSIFPNLTVWDNLDLMATQIERQRIQDTSKKFPFLNNRMKVTAGKLSGGERKILSFVRTMTEDELVFILDEPTEGVQQENIKIMAEVLNDRQANTIVVVVEQNITFIEQCASHVLVLDNGNCIDFGTINEINRNVIKKHLII